MEARNTINSIHIGCWQFWSLIHTQRRRRPSHYCNQGKQILSQRRLDWRKIHQNHPQLGLWTTTSTPLHTRVRQESASTFQIWAPKQTTGRATSTHFAKVRSQITIRNEEQYCTPTQRQIKEIYPASCWTVPLLRTSCQRYSPSNTKCFRLITIKNDKGNNAQKNSFLTMLPHKKRPY